MTNTTTQWAVIGAGPAGIACIAQLLDAGIEPSSIAWVDPSFEVGDFGTYWRYVSSNTPAKSFTKVFNTFESFGYNNDDKKYLIDQVAPDKTVPLMVAAQPMHDFTQQFRKQVSSHIDLVIQLSPTQAGWQLSMASGKKIHAHKVMLAIGAEANELPFSGVDVIPLSTAANPTLLKQAINQDDTVAVFGAYQSARTVEENLAKTNAKQIYHFYRSKREFKTHIASLDLEDRVTPMVNTADNLLKYIPKCNKAIYAVGFKRRHISIQGLPEDYSYDYSSGRIAPGIYGLGLAFPEVIPYSHGRLEYKISALQPFVKHLKEVFSQWQQEKVHSRSCIETLEV